MLPKALWKKPHTEVISFDPLDLEDSMRYHLIYHYSLGIHANHMLFLYSYLFGVFLIVSSIPSVVPLAVLATVYLIYAMYIARLAGVLFVVVGALIAFGSWSFREFLHQDQDLELYEVTGIGFAFVFGSFMFQLLGHWCFEVFNAPPSLMHGFVAAPILEMVSFQFRFGLFQEKSTKIYAQVDEIRSKADAM